MALDVMLDINVISNDQKPIIKLKTNLPPKTILMGSLISPVNQGGNGYFAQISAEVSSNQIIEFGPFSQNGDRLSAGIYQISINTVMAALQPEEVQLIIGEHGGKLTGKQITTLHGTEERGVSQTFKFRINSNGSLNNIPSDEYTSIKHTIGSADDVWEKIQSDGKEIYVKTNGFYYDKKRYSGTGFRTYIIANLPESNIVGAPQSVMNEIEGNCETRTFHVIGTLFFASKNRSGTVMNNMPPENIVRKLVPNSPLEKAFDLLCQIARKEDK